MRTAVFDVNKNIKSTRAPRAAATFPVAVVSDVQASGVHTSLAESAVRVTGTRTALHT